ncbi:MAG: recombinase family protein [Clostridiales bacterium]|nr:recombinase family protein [Clostridiales bacterium]
MKRVFLYARVSTEEQAVHGLSIEAQVKSLAEWAKANRCNVIDTYIDAGISARKPAAKRPELQRLLADARAGKGDLIVFTKLDRWFRSIAEYYKVQEILEKCHVDWRTIHEDYDTSTASGRLKINIMLSVAQDEADRTSERIKAVFETKRQKLEPLTGQMPYGYIIEGKKIVKDPKTEKAVDTFFRTFLASGSIAQAQRDVFEQCGISISYQKVHKMMGCTAYYGRYFGADGMTPPYLTEEEFERIQGMKRRVVRKSPKNNVFLFSGLVVCPECGRRMGTRRSTAADYQYYTCPGPYTMAGVCENRVCLGERKIEAFLLGAIDDVMRGRKLVYAQDEIRKTDAGYKAEISAVRGKLSRLKELYLNDLIGLEEYKADRAAFEARLNELVEKDKPFEKPDFTVLEAALSEDWRSMYSDMGKEEKRAFWRIVLREIRVYPDRHIGFDLIT